MWLVHKVFEMKAKHRREQDYWLSFSDSPTASEDQRKEFFRFDSRGGPAPEGNPIWIGKARHGITGAVLRDSYFANDGSWIGGLEMVQDYRQRDFGLRSLREWFGEETVTRWLGADD